MIAIPFEDVITQFNAFMSSPIVQGAAAWIVGIGIGAFALNMLLRAFGRGN